MMEETFAGGVAPASTHQRADLHVGIAREIVHNLVDQLLRKGDHRGVGGGGIEVAVLGEGEQPPCLRVSRGRSPALAVSAQRPHHWPKSGSRPPGGPGRSQVMRIPERLDARLRFERRRYFTSCLRPTLIPILATDDSHRQRTATREAPQGCGGDGMGGGLRYAGPNEEVVLLPRWAGLAPLTFRRRRFLDPPGAEGDLYQGRVTSRGDLWRKGLGFAAGNN